MTAIYVYSGLSQWVAAGGKSCSRSIGDQRIQETGGAFTVKRYSSVKQADAESEWRHETITLSPLNPDFIPIVLKSEKEGDVEIIAELISVMR